MNKVKLVFLDRDGVINKYPGDLKYVTNVSDFEIISGVKPALEKLTQAGFKLFIVSNQAGVAKGLYSQADLDAMDEYMKRELGEKVRFSGIYYCIHAKEIDCPCRKPKTGLIKQAIAEIKKQNYDVDIANSFFIGDSLLDIETGKAAGLKTILVFSGKEKPQNQAAWDLIPDYKAEDLASAAQIIIAS